MSEKLLQVKNLKTFFKVEAGTVKLVGTNVETIIREANKLLQDENSYNRMSKAINPYGDGIASKRIVNAILKYYELTDHEVDEFKR